MLIIKNVSKYITFLICSSRRLIIPRRTCYDLFKKLVPSQFTTQGCSQLLVLIIFASVLKNYSWKFRNARGFYRYTFLFMKSIIKKPGLSVFEHQMYSLFETESSSNSLCVDF